VARRRLVVHADEDEDEDDLVSNRRKASMAFWKHAARKRRL
jgi:hypothetical protein